ncbi:MAG TPA: Mur ligase domain-containing protein, partial [Thermoanaerobaculia bacterium]|nr:Mur ligase domain-containing protein [Thermoanaerobaculia bacterium]
MRGSVGAAAAAMGGRVVAGDPDAAWSGAAIDSRKLTGGELFFALAGEHTDGHRFVGAAAAAGAAASVVSRDVPP